MPVSVASFDGYALDGKIYMYGGTYTTHPNIGISDIWEFTPSPVSIDDDTFAPIKFTLEQNYPNPFNPSTTISWQSPIGSHQTIKLFDVLGREVETIVDGYYEAGNHSTLYIVNSALPSGVYFYQLRAVDPSAGSGHSFIQTKKMILLK